MAQIQQLPAHIADLIAAGEVVERPASVCKELLENALDAGASAVSVELEHGGLTYLRVTDNGCGIPPQQLPTAFLRHATSKLRRAEELAAIGTLGFRGEALAAIAAVSRLDVFSREPEAEAGATLHLEGGVAGETTAAGCPEGTTVCVRDLFFNTPARMKFMKKDSAEGAAAASVVMQLALSHPEVSFKLLRDGQETLHTPGDGKLLSAVYAALGRDLANSLLPVDGGSGGIRAAGYVTSPAAGQGTRGRQFFFVNGRLVKSQLLTAAVEEAYRNRLLKGRFPGCVLHISLPPETVDVNVHPAKTVVKFLSEKAVFDTVYHTVKDALDGEGRPENAIKPPVNSVKNSVNNVGNSVNSAVNTGKNTPGTVPRAANPGSAPFFRTMTAEEFLRRSDAPTAPGAAELPLGKMVTSTPGSLEVRDVVQEPGRPFMAPAGAGAVYHITPPVSAETVPDAAQAKPAAEMHPAEPEDTGEAEQQRLPLPGQDEAGEAPWRMVGEVLKTYIVCEDGERNVWLIDKHAAHERMRFDALKASTAPPMAQRLLTPAAVTLTPESYQAALEQLPLLESCGFLCEDFGGGTILVRELPDDVPEAETAATLEELTRKLLTHRADPGALRDDLLHTVACKSAIKAGMHSDGAELRELVRQVQSGAVRYCPHGRPVAAKLTEYELEKMFRRA